MKQMSREEIKMLARELYKLLRNDLIAGVNECNKEDEEWISTKEAAAFMNVSVSYVLHNILDIPHIKAGRSNKFRRSDLTEYMNTLR